MKITREQRDRLLSKLHGRGYYDTGLDSDVDAALAAAGIEVEEPPRLRLPEGPLSWGDQSLWVAGDNGAALKGEEWDGFLRWAVERYNAERPWKEKVKEGAMAEAETPAVVTDEMLDWAERARAGLQQAEEAIALLVGLGCSCSLEVRWNGGSESSVFPMLNGEFRLDVILPVPVGEE